MNLRERFFVTLWHGEHMSIAYVCDRRPVSDVHDGEVMPFSTVVFGGVFRELAEELARRLNETCEQRFGVDGDEVLEVQEQQKFHA